MAIPNPKKYTYEEFLEIGKECEAVLSPYDINFVERDVKKMDLQSRFLHLMRSLKFIRSLLHTLKAML